MKNNIIGSITMLTVVSSLSGLGMYCLNGSISSAMSAFLFAVGVQVIIGYIVNTYIIEKSRKELALAELAAQINEIEKIANVSTILNCAYCGEQNVKTFIPDEDAGFVCTKCNNENTVVVQFSVARTTTPVNNILSEPQKNHNITL